MNQGQKGREKEELESLKMERNIEAEQNQQKIAALPPTLPFKVGKSHALSRKQNIASFLWENGHHEPTDIIGTAQTMLEE